MEITAIGGYSEFGRNMTALRVKDDIIVLDAGLNIDAYSDLTEGDDKYDYTREELIKVKAIPNVKVLDKDKANVKAFVFAHAHLDHIGGLIHIVRDFPNATIIGTPFTIEVIKGIFEESRKTIKNKMQKILPDGSFKLSKDITIEMINTTHSIPQSAMVLVKTPEGSVVYASDFKLDETPMIGLPTNMKRLNQLQNENVKALIIETTYASKPGRTPSEKVAKEMLEEVLDMEKKKKKAIIVTTFASHIARLKATMDYAIKMKRKPIFLGRSMRRYIDAAEKTNIAKFTGKAEIVKYRSHVQRKLQSLGKEGKEKYLIICTGHQAEPNSILRRISTGEMKFDLDNDDVIIFSCEVIPTPKNVENRKLMEQTFARKGVKIYTSVHQSGHAAKEELEEVIQAIKPQKIFATHGELKEKESFQKTCKNLGFECIIMKNEETRKI